MRIYKIARAEAAAADGMPQGFMHPQSDCEIAVAAVVEVCNREEVAVAVELQASVR